MAEILKCFNDYVNKYFPDKAARQVTSETIAAEQRRTRAEGCMSAIQQMISVRRKATGK